MKNLAIIFTAADYPEPNSLPGTKNDNIIIKTIIHSSNKYDDIIEIDDNDSETGKNRIRQFIKKHQQEKYEIGELFFYYSGHGNYIDDEFYFLFKDYTEQSFSKSTLSNNELDNLLRSLKPKITIKLIDACQSGSTYVKDINQVEKKLQEEANKFNKCYFLFSSHQNQFSYQSNKYSFFTYAFANSIAESKQNEIILMSTIDYLKDTFRINSNQKPFFVIQADLTEIFIGDATRVKVELKKLFNHIDPKNTEKTEVKKEENEKTLVELISEKSILLATDAQIAETISKIESCYNSYSFKEDLNDIFIINKSFEVSETRFDSFLTRKIIRHVIKYNLFLFVDPIYEEETYYEYERFPKTNYLFGNLGSFFPQYENSRVEKTRQVICGFEYNSDLIPPILHFTYTPKFHILNRFLLSVYTLYSREHFYFYYEIEKQKEKGLSKWKTEGDTKLQFAKFSSIHSDECASGYIKIIEDFENMVYEECIKVTL